MQPIPESLFVYAYACCLLIVSSRCGKMSISCFEPKSSLSYHCHQFRRQPNFNPLETGAHVKKVENEAGTRSRKISQGKSGLSSKHDLYEDRSTKTEVDLDFTN